MIFSSIEIHNLGSIKRLYREFEKDLNLMCGYCSKELSYAIRLLSNSTPPPLCKIEAGARARIKAKVEIAQELYTVVAIPRKRGGGFTLTCLDEGGENVTREYLHLTAHSAEQNFSETFDGRSDGVPFRLLKYKNEDFYYCKEELSALTDGVSRLKSFRSYLNSYIKDFRPVLLRQGKPYEAVLGAGGKCYLRCTVDGKEEEAISECEKTIISYLCFLYTTEFWHGFEKLRNLHCVRKPLVISNLLERMDESADVTDLLNRTRDLRRQAFIFATCDERGTQDERQATTPH